MGKMCKWLHFFIPNLPHFNVLCTLFFPNTEIYTVNVSPPALENVRNKQISIHFGQKRKTPNNTLPLEQSFTNTLAE